MWVRVTCDVWCGNDCSILVYADESVKSEADVITLHSLGIVHGVNVKIEKVSYASAGACLSEVSADYTCTANTLAACRPAATVLPSARCWLLSRWDWGVGLGGSVYCFAIDCHPSFGIAAGCVVLCCVVVPSAW